jgi:hypothetical protein
MLFLRPATKAIERAAIIAMYLFGLMYKGPFTAGTEKYLAIKEAVKTRASVNHNIVIFLFPSNLMI